MGKTGVATVAKEGLEKPNAFLQIFAVQAFEDSFDFLHGTGRNTVEQFHRTGGGICINLSQEDFEAQAIFKRQSAQRLLQERMLKQVGDSAFSFACGGFIAAGRLSQG